MNWPFQPPRTLYFTYFFKTQADDRDARIKRVRVGRHLRQFLAERALTHITIRFKMQHRRFDTLLDADTPMRRRRAFALMMCVAGRSGAYCRTPRPTNTVVY